jgi:hypothetical protein
MVSKGGHALPKRALRYESLLRGRKGCVRAKGDGLESVGTTMVGVGVGVGVVSLPPVFFSSKIEYPRKVEPHTQLPFEQHPELCRRRRRGPYNFHAHASQPDPSSHRVGRKNIAKAG